MAASKNERAYLHKVPFGYRREPSGKLVAHLAEAPVRKQLYQLFITHGRKKVVARLLNEAGHRTREGYLFSDTTVARLLRDPLPAGKVNTPFEVEPLVSPEQWDHCQELLRESWAKQPVHLFAGIVRCACGPNMYVHSQSKSYTCQACRRSIGVAELEAAFFEQFRACFLVCPEQDSNETEVVQAWPELTPEEKRTVIEQMVGNIEISAGIIGVNVHFLPNSVTSANRQHAQKGNTSNDPVSTALYESTFKINLVTRELWESRTNLTQFLNETTRNFLCVLAANVRNGLNAPLDQDRPFAEGASADTRSAVVELRRQIGAKRCRRLLLTERKKGGKAGGVRLAQVDIVGGSGREVLRDPSAIAAASSDRSGRARRQRQKRSDA
jgi:hypothetical protein